MPRPRLMPLLVAGCLVLAVLKAHALWTATFGGMVSQAAASAPPPPATPPAPAPRPAPPAAAPAPEPDPVDAAERSLLTTLRARRAEIEAREGALAAREAVLAAAERRLTGRLEEMAALRERLESLDRARSEREEAGWRGLVRTYEAMRPRDAAAVFDELEMPVLVGIATRMRESKAAPVIGAMRPERARALTAEMARHRAGEAGR